MQLSNDTRDVLKNFSSINQNLLVKSGNVINTMSAMKNIVAKATIPDTFDNEFAIYDLNEFLSAMSLFKSPTLDFGEQSVRLNEEGGGSSLKYFFSDPSVVTTPKTEITMPSVDVEFTFTQDTFNAISKASAVLGVPDVVLKGTAGGDIQLTVTDRKNETSNDFSIKVGDNSPTDFTYFFKVENLKLLGGDYKVQVSSKGISHFSHVNKSVEYFIALEQA
ncbi:sliding clamp-like protein [Methylophilales phage Melnitz EXVC044M]|nr:sliding clamp-like protein [Methylophilales phage Melnitz-1 EXVC043M]QZI94730.1 sliding clamp-like protein [Methylophilales phage Melnitz-2 EXVC040M]QZI94952.1 sliding clamp-like protein [Methylophilales phage Melnitz EXVC044M]QZI95173.1 sliding clamp-like protein [Methylophilales phage Melnitz-3 EXVC039M]